MPSRCCSVFRLLLVSAVLCAASLLPAQTPQSPATPSPSPSHATALTIDLVVVDNTGRVPDALAPGDLTVTIDGRVRPVLWIRRVSRGPGATADATARRARGNTAMLHVAEPARTVLIVVDEGSLPVGAERLAIRASAALLDRLGMNDRVSVLTLPLLSNRLQAPTTERPVTRETINRIAGRIRPDALQVDGVTPDAQHIAGDPMGARVARDERPERPESSAASTNMDAGVLAARDSLDGLVQSLRAVARTPGRKVVVLYSAGLDDRGSGRLGLVTRALAEARASLYVVGLPVPSDDRYSLLDARLLERLARAAGGVFIKLGRSPEQDIERLTPDLSACFEIGVERTARDTIDGTMGLRVESARSGLVVRAPAMIATGAPEAGDVEPPIAEPASAAPAPAREPEGYRGAGHFAPPAVPPAPASSGGPELALVLGRLSDYAQAYIGQYSAVVAEEEYRQTLPLEKRGRRLRSDLLFVRSEPAHEWVSFRDVFEVDGVAVRDRDTRLQDLFLKSRPGAQAQLLAIKEESARHNIGPFERNINVPLYPLKILLAENRERFTFSLGRVLETAGVRTWQLDYAERTRPTLVLDRERRDVPLEGRFLVEQTTGAIVESTVQVERNEYTVSIVVRYVRDPKLGLWVPSDMKETYRVSDHVGPLGAQGAIILEGNARYSRFRRFQVSTEEKVVIPK